MRDRLKIFGIDIIRGSVRSRTRRPLYALVRMEDGEITSEDEVTGFRLFRMLAAEEPDILAVDSLQEIAASQQELYSFLQSLPPSVRLVQVTGGERKESLVKVAGRYNIRFNRLDPFDEARTIARVASLGAGAEVIAFSDQSEVTVTRHRSPGKGGWSQNRYVRKIHGAVRQRAREVEMALVAAGLKYEKKETRAFGGCSKVAFRVYASRDQLPVSTYRGADVQVRIQGRRRDRIMFRPVSAKPRYLIVGIDPGTTTAVAALDLDGNILNLHSSRQTSMSDVIESLYRVGKPLIIASDVSDMPFTVEKIRRAFNAVAYSPRHDMSVEAKAGMTGPYSCANDHERDALSAALDAYRHYKNKFQNLVKRVPPGHDLDEVRAGVIRGQPLDQVLGELKEKKPSKTEEIPEIEINRRYDERVRVLDGMVKRLRGYVQELQEEMQQKDHEISHLKARLHRVRSAQEVKLRKDVEITKRDVIIQNLKKRLKKEKRATRNLRKRLALMKDFDEMLKSADSVPMKILSSLTRESVRSLDEEVGILEGDIIYIHRIDVWGRTAVRDLADRGVVAVIIADKSLDEADPLLEAAFRENAVPLLSGSWVGAMVRGRQGLLSKGKLKTALEHWEKEHKSYELEKKSAMLNTIYREYRTERDREMKKSE